MKIEIDIDIEAIIRQEIRAYIQENLIINNVAGTLIATSDVLTAEVDHSEPTAGSVEEATPAAKAPTRPGVKAPEGGWEFAPKAGRRRNTAEIAMHTKELELGRRLTPTEKGVAQGNVASDENTEAKAKEDTMNKNRINGIVEELNEENAAAESPEPEAVDTETTAPETVAAESTDASAIPFNGPIEAAEEQIPQTEELPDVASLFK